MHPNGDFGIWQRGTEFTSPGDDTYTVDRWNLGFSGGDAGAYTISRQPFDLGQTEVPGDPQYYVHWEQTKAGSEPFLDFSQQIEDVRTFAGQQVTISAWMRAQPAGSSPVPNLYFKTEQYFGTTRGQPVTPSLFRFTTTPLTVAPYWERLTFTTVLANIGGKPLGQDGNSSLNVIISLPIQQTFIIDIADVQIELGNTATAFERVPIGRQLEDCQRYFQKSYGLDMPPGAMSSLGSINFRQLSDNHVQPVHLHKSMRCPPKVTLYNPVSGSTGTWYGETYHETPVAAYAIVENYFHANVTDNGQDRAFLAGHWTADAEFDVDPFST